jgi:hypothetical protein
MQPTNRFRTRANAGTIKGQNRTAVVANIHPHTASMIAQAGRVPRLANIQMAHSAIAGRGTPAKGKR